MMTGNYRLSKIDVKEDGLHIEFIPNAKPLNILVKWNNANLFWKEIDKIGDSGICNLSVDVKQLVEKDAEFRFDYSPQWMRCEME